MECTICTRAIGSELSPFNCATCARATLFPYRAQLAEVLLEREKEAKRVTAVVQGDESAETHYSIRNSHTTIMVDREKCTMGAELEQTKAETALIKETTTQINEHATMLHQQIEQARKDLAARKAVLAQRRSDLQSVGHNITARRKKELDKVQETIQKTEHSWDKYHSGTVKARVTLCEEAAKLSGLKQKWRKAKDGGLYDVYYIGPGDTLPIVDLRDLNNASFFEVSASMTAVAQLVVQISHYLTVRLPAEITLAHRDYPLPTIFSPSSSYQSRDVPFPGSTPTASTSNSPDASRNFEHHRPLPHPRTLFIDRPLMDLATQDPQAYAMFLEGVSLLAYDVAWLCRTQGMQDEFNDWEDVCSMGKNLFRLLLEQGHRPETTRNDSLREPTSGAGRSQTGTPTQPSKASVKFGEFSHGTSHSFLGAAENAGYLRGWKLTPPKIVDSLKAMLLADQQVQGWEVLDQKEWHGMDDVIAEEPILVGPKRRNTGLTDDTRSVMSVATSAAATAATAAVETEGAGQGKARGVNGWTKLKSRTSEGSK
ncbi:uncharacterized protein BDZ99DRAFT_500922 [Mytilinidion resinicola]|uniref:Autophagy-related protein 14 n=1 Tax=Mytilinidion resinicola TaxID=574789 RepID=A0A6A6YEC9_9PEZI|nr:uncharacterized protein BDZ99DRAFT_500922 [Mytilinidion resinicola]KAF2806883.1 hypothetical protein BDZ99DRAFT_500922 [Mytilinidion resinicola]